MSKSHTKPVWRLYENDVSQMYISAGSAFDAIADWLDKPAGELTVGNYINWRGGCEVRITSTGSNSLLARCSNDQCDSCPRRAETLPCPEQDTSPSKCDIVYFYHPPPPGGVICLSRRCKCGVEHY